MCGNFGLLLLNLAAGGRIDELLDMMLRVTMARGAQSAGLVTYRDGKGTRKRVVNGKRTDLCDKLMHMFARELRRKFTKPTIFQGHTRFATTSIAGFDGCHPHQFSPPRQAEVWRYDPSTKATFKPSTCNVETFITHNGDLDFFELQEVLIPLSGLQALLPALLHSPLPNSGDSVCVAGLLELMRTAGVWKDSVRFGYVFGALEWAASPMVLLNNNELWSAQTLARVTALFEEEWKKVMARPEEAPSLEALRTLFTATMQDELRPNPNPSTKPTPKPTPTPSPSPNPSAGQAARPGRRDPDADAPPPLRRQGGQARAHSVAHAKPQARLPLTLTNPNPNVNVTLTLTLTLSVTRTRPLTRSFTLTLALTRPVSKADIVREDTPELKQVTASQG